MFSLEWLQNSSLEFMNVSERIKNKEQILGDG